MAYGKGKIGSRLPRKILKQRRRALFGRHSRKVGDAEVESIGLGLQSCLGVAFELVAIGVFNLKEVFAAILDEESWVVVVIDCS